MVFLYLVKILRFLVHFKTICANNVQYDQQHYLLRNLKELDDTFCARNAHSVQILNRLHEPVQMKWFNIGTRWQFWKFEEVG